MKRSSTVAVADRNNKKQEIEEWTSIRFCDLIGHSTHFPTTGWKNKRAGKNMQIVEVIEKIAKYSGNLTCKYYVLQSDLSVFQFKMTGSAVGYAS